MTTRKASLQMRHHERQVAEVMNSVSDIEIIIEMQALSNQYATIRSALRLAINEIIKLDDEYGTEHTDLAFDLGQMIGGLRSEELSMQYMITAAFGDDTETAGV